MDTRRESGHGHDEGAPWWWPVAAALVVLCLVSAAILVCTPSPAQRRRAKAEAIARAVRVERVEHATKAPTVVVEDASRPEGSVVTKGERGVRTVTYLVERSSGKRTKIDERVTARPTPRIVTTRRPGSGHALTIDAPGGKAGTSGRPAAPADPDGGPATGGAPAGVPTTDGTTDGTVNDTTDGGTAPQTTIGQADFVGHLRDGGVGMLDGTPVTWADVSVLGVGDDAMTDGRGLPGGVPLHRDEHGVWHTGDGAIAAGAAAQVPIGQRIETAIGTIVVVDHDESGTWNIMTDWRHLPQAAVPAWAGDGNR